MCAGNMRLFHLLLLEASKPALALRLETLCGPTGEPPVAARRETLGSRSKPHQAGMIYIKERLAASATHVGATHQVRLGKLSQVITNGCLVCENADVFNVKGNKTEEER